MYEFAFACLNSCMCICLCDEWYTNLCWYAICVCVCVCVVCARVWYVHAQVNVYYVVIFNVPLNGHSYVNVYVCMNGITCFCVLV